MYFFYKKTKYILKVRSLKNIVIWIFKMAAPDSKMADMQNKVVVFIVTGKPNIFLKDAL